jgi:thiol oxidase
VHTADDGVLKGTVRDVVLKTCKELGVAVIFEPPATSSYPTWDGVS